MLQIPLLNRNNFIFTESWWSQFLYLYLPMILIMACNSTFFLLTSLKIRKVQKEMARITKKEDSTVHRKNVDKEKAR